MSPLATLSYKQHIIFLVQLDSLCFSGLKNIAHPVYFNVILT
jgi:hypothetical protein